VHLRLPAEAAAEDPEPQNGESSTSRPTKRRKYDTRGIPDEYEVQVPKDRAKNTFVFQETMRDWGLGQDGKTRKNMRGMSDVDVSTDH
jgi:transcription initiation factor TFIIF subunit beta